MMIKNPYSPKAPLVAENVSVPLSLIRLFFNKGIRVRMCGVASIATNGAWGNKGFSIINCKS